MTIRILLAVSMLSSIWACQSDAPSSSSSSSATSTPVAQSFINVNNEPFYSIYQYIQAVNQDDSLTQRTTTFSRDNANYTILGYRKPDKTVLKLIGETHSLTSSKRMAYIIRDRLPVYIHGLYKTFNCDGAETVCVDEVEHYLENGHIIGSQIRSKKMSRAEAEKPNLSDLPYVDFTLPRDSVWKSEMSVYINYENSL